MKNVLLILIFFSSILFNADVSFAMKRSENPQDSDNQTQIHKKQKISETESVASENSKVEIPAKEISTYDEFCNLIKDYDVFHILSAEDVKTNQDQLASIIKVNPKCTIEFAKNGNEFLDLFNSKPEDYYHMSFMDWGMPDMDGLATVKILRKMKDRKIPPIIGISAEFLPFKIQEFMDAGLDEYVEKPATPETLFSAINECLRMKALKHL